jgi:ATP-dependent helicase/nuclease subunit B
VNTAFLEDIADLILKEHEVSKLHKVTVVLPSRRAGLFLRKHLVKKIKQTFLSPKIITIDEIVKEIAEADSTDNTVLLFELYKAYQEIEKELSEPFENFSKWGQIMLTDFNEIDRYLIDAKSFFRDLRNIQEIEDWSFNDENLSPSQEKYLSFWLKMGVYYQSFYERCEKEKIYSSGRIYRIASQKVDSKVNNYQDQSIYIGGFNAISKSEEKIIDSLCSSNKAVFLADSDAWYSENPNHEAGTFIRQLKNKKWFADNPVHQHFKNIEREIKIYGVPGNTLQAQVAGQILSGLSEEDLNDTVVVLADEQLLLPVINSLPDNVTAANITMGYSLRNTTLFTFIAALFEMQCGMRVSKNGNIRFYAPDVLRVLTNSECVSLSLGKSAYTSDKIIQSGKSFLSADELKIFIDDALSILPLFIPWENAQTDGLTCIADTLDKLHELYSDKKRSVQQEFVFTALKSINQLISLLEKYPFVSETRSVQKLCLQILKSESIPFYGEPLKGLQIIGMLESRALDFKNIILLSANEDVLPKGNNLQSLIPYDLKQYYKLPTYRETDAVFAHHFYRLIQRGVNVNLFYNSSGDKMGGGEKSRFLLQILEEFPENIPNTKLQEIHASFSHLATDKSELIVKNSPEIIGKINLLLESGLSPSAIAKYLDCPLDFYYQYVVGLREKDFDENIDDARFGTIIHHILQLLYTPFIGKKLEKENLAKMKLLLPEISTACFLEEMKNADITTGKNYLSNKVILQYCERVINHDLELIKEGELVILELEQSLKEIFHVYPLGIETEINLKGNVDRIDRYKGETRIIDYKTGKTDEISLKITDPDKLADKSKAIQLMIYALSYMKKSKITKATSLHYGLRQIDNIEIPLNILGSKEINLSDEELLTNTLTEIIQELLDEKTVFSHEPKSEYCKFCQ